MERQRNIKILSIVALVLAITGMTLGFAAFSTTLNISSSASVSPSSDDFKVILCEQAGICEGYEDAFMDFQVYNGAIGNESASAYDNTISGLDAGFTKPNQKVEYTFYVDNIGEYDAYLRSVTFDVLDNGSYKKCSASTTDSTKATDSLVQAACDGIRVTINIGGTTYELGSTNISGHRLPKGTSETVYFTLEYVDGSALADGPFNVEIADFKFNYSTVDNTEVNLISFIVKGVSYQAEEGMTWREWVDSIYNIDGWEISGNNVGLDSGNGVWYYIEVTGGLDNYIVADFNYMATRL